MFYLYAKRQNSSDNVKIKAKSNANTMVRLSLKNTKNGTLIEDGGHGQASVSIPPKAVAYEILVGVAKLRLQDGGAPNVTLSVKQDGSPLELNDEVPGSDPNPIPVEMTEEGDTGFYLGDIRYLIIEA